MKPIPRSALPVLFAAIGLAACSGPSVPTHYYILTPIAPAAAPQGAAVVEGPAVELDRVIVPEYLNQPAIVTRSQSNEVERAQDDHWAGPLGDEVTRALSENLALAVPTDRLSVGTRSASQTDFTVEVEIVSFERDPAGIVHLIARWSVFRAEGKTPLAMRRTSYRQPADTANYANTVAAMSRALGDLSRDIATVIRNAAVPEARPPAAGRPRRGGA